MATGKINSATTLRWGPNTTTYDLDNSSSVSTNEVVTVLWSESNFYYIEYNVGSGTTKKRMYVPTSNVTITSGSVPTYTSTNETRYILANANTLYAPYSNSAAAGSLSRSEEVKYTGKKEGDYALIDYPITGSSKRKRAWFPHMSMGNTPPTSTIIQYKNGATIAAGLPFAGSRVTQGFNDKTTNFKGHLGYDIVVSGGAIKPIFAGTVVGTGNTTYNGLTVTVYHSEGVVHPFYSTYCHLASIAISSGTVSTSSTLGVQGSTGTTSEHLHLATYTLGSTNDPSGYCSDGKNLTFEQVMGNYTNSHLYYGGSTSWPRCNNGKKFFDPYAVISTNGAIIGQV